MAVTERVAGVAAGPLSGASNLVDSHPGTSRARTLASASGARNAGSSPVDQTAAFEEEMGRELR